MASRNYIVMTNDMSLSDKRGYRMAALAAGLERCGLKGIGDVNAHIPGLSAVDIANKEARVKVIMAYISTGAWPRSIDQRELQPIAAGPDLVAGTALDMWLTAALAVVGNPYSCFQAIAAPQLIQGRLMVCYGISVESAVVPMPVSRVLFRRGGAAGNIQAVFDLEPMGVRQETDAFFSEPVVIDPMDVFAIQVICRAIAAATPLHIHNFLFESSGSIIA